ncbi:beta-4C adrenergic receptor-like [Stylophora pistillata]|uniref:beta-4C adrenergic receptor-like n=1 Tax=Stylophora pistillata TaxID=50429 RepID=UPI000C0451A9|nr:beta-4C adrenergic receptor-like [Stylophora pistillata]
MKYPDMEQRPLALVVIEPAILVTMAIVCSTGNLLICISICRNPALRTTTNVFVFALAISDLLNSIAVMLLTVGVLITGKWPYGEIMCNFHAFFTLFSVYVSPTTMGLAAINRYIRIVKTRSYPHIFTPFLSKLYVCAVWMFVAGYVAIPRLAGWTAYGFIPGYAVCTIVHPTEAAKITHYCVVVSLFLVLPFTLAIFCYYKVFETIKQHNMNIITTFQRAGQDGHLSIREIKITKSLAVIVLAFGLCWIPFWIIAMIQRFTSSVVPRNVQLVCTFLLFFSSTVNPFIYAGTNEAFKAEFRRVLYCRRNRIRDRVQIQEKTMTGLQK